MTPVKQVLFEIQQSEKRRVECCDIENADQLIKDYIQYLKNKIEVSRIYFKQLVESDFTNEKLKTDIKDFIRTL